MTASKTRKNRLKQILINRAEKKRTNSLPIVWFCMIKISFQRKSTHVGKESQEFVVFFDPWLFSDNSWTIVWKSQLEGFGHFWRDYLPSWPDLAEQVRPINWHWIILTWYGPMTYLVLSNVGRSVFVFNPMILKVTASPA